MNYYRMEYMDDPEAEGACMECNEDGVKFVPVTFDYWAAISHLEWIRGLRLTPGQMAEVFGAGVTGEWGGDDEG